MTDRPSKYESWSVADLCRTDTVGAKAELGRRASLLARCYDVCAEAIGSEYRNVGVVEACASFVGTLQADFAAERQRRLEAETERDQLRELCRSWEEGAGE